MASDGIRDIFGDLGCLSSSAAESSNTVRLVIVEQSARPQSPCQLKAVGVPVLSADLGISSLVDVPCPCLVGGSLTWPSRSVSTCVPCLRDWLSCLGGVDCASGVHTCMA